MPRGASSRSTRTSRAPPRKKRLLEKLPEAFRAYQDGWKLQEVNTPVAYVLLNDEEYNEQFLQTYIQSTYSYIAESIAASLSLHGQGEVNMVNSYERLLSSDAIDRVSFCTNPALVSLGHPPTNPQEFCRFLHHKNLVLRFNLSLDKAWECVMPQIAESNKFSLMALSRFKVLLHNIRGYPSEGRNGNDDKDTWLENKNSLCHINELEVAIFKPSVDVLLNKTKTGITVDDELLSSRADDVETKILTLRKMGKEGPTIDTVSDASTGIMYAMRLRVKEELQHSNVKKMLETLPKATLNRHHIRMFFDRGYGKMSFVDEVLKRGYQICTIASTIGSRHPFILTEDLQGLQRKWQEKKEPEDEKDECLETLSDWTLDAGDVYGAESKTAVQEITYTNETGTRAVKKTLHATIIRDVFDKKKTTKELRFFSTGPMEDTIKNTWVAVRKSVYIPPHTLFQGDDKAEKREIENQLRLFCQPLTKLQRTCDWFNQKAFRLTGTMAGQVVSVAADNNEITDDLFQKLMEECIDSWFGRHKATSLMAKGSANETPTTEKLAKEEWISDFFETGLL